MEFPSGPEGQWRTMSEEGVVCWTQLSPHRETGEEPGGCGALGASEGSL